MINFNNKTEVQKPKSVDGVSIVIPTYNRCLHPNDERNPLMWCISSIKQQTHEGIEIIVVDDASTDKTYMNLTQNFGEDPLCATA
jgi:glycosyltransferase involved in cell wall biosynthesis